MRYSRRRISDHCSKSLRSVGFRSSYHSFCFTSSIFNYVGSSNSRGCRYFRPTLFLFRICLSFSFFLGSSTSSSSYSSTSPSTSSPSSSSSSCSTRRQQAGLLTQNLRSSLLVWRSKRWTQESRLAAQRQCLVSWKSVTEAVMPLNLPTTCQSFRLSHRNTSPMSLLKQYSCSPSTSILVSCTLSVVARAISRTGRRCVPRISQRRSLRSAWRTAMARQSLMKAASISFMGTYRSSSSFFTFLPNQSTAPVTKFSTTGTTPAPQKRYRSWSALEVAKVNLLCFWLRNCVQGRRSWLGYCSAWRAGVGMQWMLPSERQQRRQAWGWMYSVSTMLSAVLTVITCSTSPEAQAATMLRAVAYRRRSLVGSMLMLRTGALASCPQRWRALVLSLVWKCTTWLQPVPTKTLAMLKPKTRYYNAQLSVRSSHNQSEAAGEGDSSADDDHHDVGHEEHGEEDGDTHLPVLPHHGVLDGARGAHHVYRQRRHRLRLAHQQVDLLLALQQLLQVLVEDLVHLLRLLPQPRHVVHLLRRVVQLHVAPQRPRKPHRRVHDHLAGRVEGVLGEEELADVVEEGEGDAFGVLGVGHDQEDEVFVEDVEDVVAGRELAVLARGRAALQDLLGSQHEVAAEGRELRQQHLLTRHHRVYQRHIKPLHPLHPHPTTHTASHPQLPQWRAYLPSPLSC